MLSQGDPPPSKEEIKAMLKTIIKDWVCGWSNLIDTVSSDWSLYNFVGFSNLFKLNRYLFANALISSLPQRGSPFTLRFQVSLP